MSTIEFTPEQRHAIEAGCGPAGAGGHSLIVSAAAGSGKTSVLTERCAYLVCDAAPHPARGRRARCDIDELLVLTFTEAAAAAMRSRIIDAIRSRSEASPEDERLAQQVALVESAQISTIHSFCLWLIRRWFTHVDIDPGAFVLDADESVVLKRQVLDRLFSELYGITRQPGDPLGRPGAPGSTASDARDDAAGGEGDRHERSAAARSKTAVARAFVKLVDDYGLGSDHAVVEFILNLHDFTGSLPDPDGWLADAHRSLTDDALSLVRAVVDDLARELAVQLEDCAQRAAGIEAGHEIGAVYASQIREYAGALANWGEGLAPAEPEQARGDEEWLRRFESVRAEIAAFSFGKTRAPRLSKDADPAVLAARAAAQQALKHVKEDLFGSRLKKEFALFTVDELLDGLNRTAPYVRTIVELVWMFRDAYARKKREMMALDFADLERFAFQLLCDPDTAGRDPQTPSAVARALHERFAHVLVDEFQDINPLQEAIIRLVSREACPHRDNNLFVVGDIKQSIYRFRLAEPAVFAERLERFSTSTRNEAGEALSLQKNFRSTPEILDAVNLVFGQLMPAAGGDVVYDAEAELRPGREPDSGASGPRHPVELHVLERTWKGTQFDDDFGEQSGYGTASLSDPSRWTAIEREAYFMASRIREWKTIRAPKANGEPIQYRDVAVLLRATKINAEQVAAMLNRMGVPAFADTGGSLFSAREVRDVLAALQVLDNVQQDIPLAGVLRSGILGQAFSADELATIRCSQRNVPFHAAVRAFAESDRPQDTRKLAERLRSLLECISRYRADMRRRPLADVLWGIYLEHGYLAHVGGLPNGAQRRANLLRLHELARGFSPGAPGFRRQGLHRFLRFVEALQEEERELATATPIGEAEDVVRVMSIHQAKGLEFPVVFVAGLGTRFHLGDRSGRMIFERKPSRGAGVGLRVVDPDRMIEYPSAAHRLVAREIEQSTRAEELRILYVAMTRAQDRLILLGSQRNARNLNADFRAGARSDPPSRLAILTATTPLEWLIPTMRAAAAEGKRASAVRSGIALHVHDVDEMSRWAVGKSVEDENEHVRRAIARGADLPPYEPLAPDDPGVKAALSRIEYVYPHLASSSVRAAIAASEFKGTFDYTVDPEVRATPLFQGAFEVPPSKYGDVPGAPGGDDAVRRGVMTHRILQFLDFDKAVDAPGVAAELQRMVDAGVIHPDALATVDRGSIEWFVSTPLAEAIRAAGDQYRREFAFITAEPLEVFDRSVGVPSGAPGEGNGPSSAELLRRTPDEVLVRGIVDGVLCGRAGDGIEIVDFKTDVIQVKDVPQRAERYRPQMELYTRAMSRLWTRPVRACWLVFLAPRRITRLNSDSVDGESRIATGG
ncbi:MAG: UvrD-helicase domain-containing protein [Phycisphaerae bacterium]|jgi:ATP-dependent helicase/nuclease subunit A